MMYMGDCDCNVCRYDCDNRNVPRARGVAIAWGLAPCVLMLAFVLGLVTLPLLMVVAVLMSVRGAFFLCTNMMCFSG